MAAKGVRTRKYDASMVMDLLKASSLRPGREAETKTERTVFTGGREGPELHIQEKSTQFAGKFGDLFQKGESRLRIKNARGQTVRIVQKIGDSGKVRIDPMTGNPGDVIVVDENDDLLLEPWFMDFGSVLFVPKNPPVGFPKERPLKLATENDEVEYFARRSPFSKATVALRFVPVRRYWGVAPTEDERHEVRVGDHVMVYVKGKG